MLDQADVRSEDWSWKTISDNPHANELSEEEDEHLMKMRTTTCAPLHFRLVIRNSPKAEIYLTPHLEEDGRP